MIDNVEHGQVTVLLDTVRLLKMSPLEVFRMRVSELTKSEDIVIYAFKESVDFIDFLWVNSHHQIPVGYMRHVLDNGFTSFSHYRQ